MEIDIEDKQRYLLSTNMVYVETANNFKLPLRGVWFDNPQFNMKYMFVNPNMLKDCEPETMWVEGCRIFKTDLDGIVGIYIVKPVLKTERLTRVKKVFNQELFDFILRYWRREYTIPMQIENKVLRNSKPKKENGEDDIVEFEDLNSIEPRMKVKVKCSLCGQTAIKNSSAIRKHNYCNSCKKVKKPSRAGIMECVCHVCKKTFKMPLSRYNQKIKLKQRFTCSAYDCLEYLQKNMKKRGDACLKE
jgi:hypothetical protein